MIREFSKLNTLGVMNITPNSFSDGKKFQDEEILVTTLKKNLSRTNLIFDFGFESTAPMNQAISLDEERARFETFFKQIESIDLSGQWISFDTYRPSNFLYFSRRFNERYSDLNLIFNDVSGVIDDELIALLKSKKCDPRFYYIYSFTHIPSRGHVLDHMKYLVEGDILVQTREKFQKALTIFRELGVEDKIIFDPCFGFSKTYEQNWELVKHFDKLVRELPLDVPWLVGISKKSFIRKALPDSTDPFVDAEKLHEKIIREITVKKLGHILFRVHDFDIVERANAGL
jgi:dihydropteroate synthase